MELSMLDGQSDDSAPYTGDFREAASGSARLAEIGTTPEASPVVRISLKSQEFRNTVLRYWMELRESEAPPSHRKFIRKSEAPFSEDSFMVMLAGSDGAPEVVSIGQHARKKFRIDRTVPFSLYGINEPVLTQLAGHIEAVAARRKPSVVTIAFSKEAKQVGSLEGVLLPFAGSQGEIESVYCAFNWRGAGLDKVARPAGAGAEVLMLRHEMVLEDDQSEELLLESEFSPSGESAEGELLLQDELETAKDAPALIDKLLEAQKMVERLQDVTLRSQLALYQAIARAYEFSFAAIERPAEYLSLLKNSGLKMQERAPMTPIVKLVFGVDYDKTRITEYSATLSYAHRLQLAPGQLADFLTNFDGGIRGVIAEERRLRRIEKGQAAPTDEESRLRLVRKLRTLPVRPLSEIKSQGEEFMLVLTRQMPDGGFMIVGELPQNAALLERAARKVLS